MMISSSMSLLILLSITVIVSRSSGIIGSSSVFVEAYFPANDTSYLNFHIPTTLRRNVSWPHVSSMFGRLGHGREGRLVLPVKILKNKNQTKLCDAGQVDRMNVISKQLHILPDGGSPFILLIERGDCTFVKKVRNAQHLGASGVIIGDTGGAASTNSDYFVDSGAGIAGIDLQHHRGLGGRRDILAINDKNGTDPDDLDPEKRYRLAGDGSELDISIPSLMISKEEYDELMKVITKDDEKRNGNVVVAEIAWHLPKNDNQVTMEMWYSPIDTHTKEFIASNFSSIARTFDLNNENQNMDETTYDHSLNLLRYKERPVLLDGKSIGCVGNDEAPDEACYKLCTNNGRYCHVSHRMTDGKDIVLESLRRLCIEKHYPIPKYYWDYIDQFSRLCWDHDYFANEKCVEDAYSHSNIDKTVIDACIADSGAPERDEENSLLQHSLDMQLKYGIHQSPIVTINHDVSPAITFQGLTSRTVMYSLCETFSYGKKPHVCYACMMCGDPVACAKRNPMACQSGDGVEKEDPNAHKSHQSQDDGGGGHHHRRRHWGHFFFGLFLIGGVAGVGYVYYKKQQEGGSSLGGGYSLHDAFLSSETSRD